MGVVRTIATLALSAGLSLPAPAQPPRESTPLSRSFEQVGFEAILDKGGVSVYRDARADVVRLGADGTLDGRPEEVVESLLDYESHPDFMHRVVESRILKRGKDRLLVYQRLDLPLIDDRDFNLAVTWGESDGVHWIGWRASVEGIAPVDGVVRMPVNRGSWQIRATEDGHGSQARFQVRMDIAGWVPRWMARARAGDEVPAMFHEMTDLIHAQAAGRGD